MTTIMLKINERTKAGKTLISMLNFFTSEKEGVEIIKTGSEKRKTENNTPYNPQFVEMVLNAAKSENRTKVTSKNLWQSL
ncbi:MAG: hypothetical protein EAY66_09290 [Sphingobacteriales bacterium]|nr:MAG: hypothetical protein EAY66_09290 [Sphingobacteriales bacterium]